MLFELSTNFWRTKYEGVLILILMEYALWVDMHSKDCYKNMIVLILILMEYALWVTPSNLLAVTVRVLILILMEYALWDGSMFKFDFEFVVLILILMEYALWVVRNQIDERNSVHVLILILMEYALWAVQITKFCLSAWVLILILMEYALWGREIITNKAGMLGLNPYSNGICSLSLPFELHSSCHWVS